MNTDFSETEIKAYENEYNNLLKLANENSSAVAVRGAFSKAFLPYVQFITFDALKKEDWPSNIGENSVFLTFEIDQKAKKVSLYRGGHTYLSPKDKAPDSKWKYYAMRGILNIAAEDYGVKKFRKQGYKSVDDLYKKMETCYKAVMEAITKYTGGYPYKQGIVA